MPLARKYGHFCSGSARASRRPAGTRRGRTALLDARHRDKKDINDGCRKPESHIWLIVWGGLFYLMMRYGCGAHMMDGHNQYGTAMQHRVD
jgi:hypothetical protein